MPEMNSIERVMCALQRKVPDRVPHFEWMVDCHVREVLCPDAKDALEFYDQMDWDAGVLSLRIQLRSTALK